MTSVGIVGAGRAATLHAEAVRAARGLELAGVAPLSSASLRAAALADALGCPVLTLPELSRACDAVVVATPPAARAELSVELASSRRLKAVMVESPAATTLEDVAHLESALADRPVMAGVNLLHAPAVRRLLEAVAAMDPHHLELRLAVPDPRRGPAAGVAFGGGVTVDPAAGFWPIMVAAMGAGVESVAAPRFEVVDGLDRVAVVVLEAVNGRRARAELRWGARVAEAAVEAADSAHVARLEVWPVPVVEMDGSQIGPRADPSQALAALGFVTQIERLARVCRGEAAPWPALTASTAALTIAVAASLSAREGGTPVNVRDVPADASPFEILNA